MLRLSVIFFIAVYALVEDFFFICLSLFINNSIIVFIPILGPVKEGPHSLEYALIFQTFNSTVFFLVQHFHFISQDLMTTVFPAYIINNE